MRDQSTFSQNWPLPRNISFMLFISVRWPLIARNPSLTSQVLRLTAWRNEWNPWSDITITCVPGSQALEHLADELVDAAVDAQDRVAVLRGVGLVVHRVRLVDEAPHHVLHAVGRLDDADEQVPLPGVDAVQR